MATIHCTVQDSIAHLVIDNAARLNAMTLGMWTQLAETLSALAPRNDVRVVLLRGAGEKAFVSGADISEFEAQRSNPDSVAAYDAAVERAQSALSAFPRPVIAAIEGICYGGGLGLALASDIRLAGRSARFRMPAARLGLGYAYRGVKRMVDLLGPTTAGEFLYTARVCGANEAQRIGLVSTVHDDVFAHAQALAAEIAANAPLSIAAAKLAIHTTLDPSPAACDRVAQAVSACFGSDDYREGRVAFAQKRAPRFHGQ